MREDVYMRMYEVEDRHWWFAGKRRIIRDLVARYAPCAPVSGGRLLADIGCGCGRALEELPAGWSGTGVDSSPLAIECCGKRGVAARLGALPDELGLAENAFDAAIFSDVLEHIDDDAAAARSAARLLKPGGIAIFTVPALPSLWTSWDDIHGHRRRYTKATLARALDNAGLERDFISYYNTLLFPAALAGRLVSRFLKLESAPELRLPPKWLNASLLRVFAAEGRILRRCTMPVGLSLVAVMRKPAG